MNPLPFLRVCCAGWMNRRQQVAIEYLQEEIRVLKEQLGKHARMYGGLSHGASATPATSAPIRRERAYGVLNFDDLLFPSGHNLF